jgi:vacuolar-type H+-ATPase subunit H
MDDILKRMLLVEEQADEIVAAAEQEAKKILTASRQRINDENIQAQHALTKEYDALLATRLAAARQERDQALAEADQRHAAELKAFAQGLEGRMKEVKEALAYPSSS